MPKPTESTKEFIVTRQRGDGIAARITFESNQGNGEALPKPTGSLKDFIVTRHRGDGLAAARDIGIEVPEHYFESFADLTDAFQYTVFMLAQIQASERPDWSVNWLNQAARHPFHQTLRARAESLEKKERVYSVTRPSELQSFPLCWLDLLQAIASSEEPDFAVMDLACAAQHVPPLEEYPVGVEKDLEFYFTEQQKAA